MPYTVKKIDIHVHSFIDYGMSLPFENGAVYATYDDIRKKYDDWGIEYGILLPLTKTECSIRAFSNEQAKYLADKHPDTFKWFMYLDPRMIHNSPTTDFTRVIEFFRSHGALGVGEVAANLRFDDPLMDNMLYHINAAKLPMTIHLAPDSAKYGYYGIRDELGLPGLEKMLKKYPDIKVLGHSQVFWAHMSADVNEKEMDGYPNGKVTPGGRIVQLLREYPNLYCDMSAGSGFNALERDTDHAYKFIEEFADRLLFGTDICCSHNFMPLSGWLDESVMNGCISQENYIKISRGNAERLLGL